MTLVITWLGETVVDSSSGSEIYCGRGHHNASAVTGPTHPDHCDDQLHDWPQKVPLSIAKGLDHGWEGEKGHLCDSRRAVLLSVSRQKCWPAHMKHNERSKRVLGGGVRNCVADPCTPGRRVFW